MKNYFNQIALISLIIGGLLATSCTETTEPLPQADTAIADEAMESNQAFEDLDYLTMYAIETSGMGARRLDNPQETICESFKISQNPDLNKITLDFGTNCKSKDGIERKGKIYLTYSGNMIMPGSTITASFDGFEVNKLKIQGTRTMTTMGFNLFENSIALSVKIKDGKVIWPDGKFITFESTQTRTIKIGASGYQIKISGNSTGISKDKIAYTSTIIKPLEISENCIKTGVYIPSAGITEFVSPLGKISVDFGAGECDKTITITTPAGTKEITLD